MDAFHAQIFGEMLAVVLSRVAVFGEGQAGALTDDERTVRPRDLYHSGVFG